MPPTREEELLAKLLPTFKLEAQEHSRRIASLLAGLERASDPQALEDALRTAHTLKGAARAVGFRELEMLCQEVESVLARWKKGELSPSSRLFELLYLAFDAVEAIASSPAASLSDDERRRLSQVRQTVSRLLEEPRADQGVGATLDALRTAAAPAEPGTAAPGAAAMPDAAAGKEPPEPAPVTVRVAAPTVDELVTRGEELIAEKYAASQRVEELRALLERLDDLRRRTAAPAKTRDGAALSAQLANVAAELGLLTRTTRSAVAKAEGGLRVLQGKVDALLESARELVMLPASTLLEAFPRLVRELARETGKEAELSIGGEDVLLDRRVSEALRDPLVHCLRNSVSHGIEPAGERERLGKPRRGSVRLSLSRPDPHLVEIVVRDDGRGMDAQKLRAAAVVAGVLTQAEAAVLSDQDAYGLCFASGVSTDATVTEISGRGLGLAIVREAVEKLGGQTRVDSARGTGTAFRLVVPTAVAAFRGVVVSVGGRNYVFPATAVERVTRVAPGEIGLVQNRESVLLEGEIVPVVRAAGVLEVAAEHSEPGAPLPLVVVDVRGARIAFHVDEVLYDQDFVVKPLGPQLRRVRNISGAASLPTGETILVLNPEDMVRCGTGAQTARRPSLTVAPAEQTSPKRILVVDDSITSRTLLRHILEASGFEVATAGDGSDGLSRVRQGRFELVVSDVEMPRVDGFEFTHRVREDFPDLPVILVTTRDSPEDRRRGLEAGADAYIVKSSFDQEELLLAIRRLL